MHNYIKAYSIGEAWLHSIEAILANGKEIQDDQGNIIEIVPFFIEIFHPSQNDKIIDMYSDTKYIDFLAKNFEDLSPIDEWGYSYAQRLYAYNDTNQIQGIIDKLNKNPLSKSATISLLNNIQDVKHTPCLTTLDFKVRESDLIINATFRSQDIGKKMYGDALELLKLGKQMIHHLPANEIILIHSISSAHIYCNDLEKIRVIIDSTQEL